MCIRKMEERTPANSKRIYRNSKQYDQKQVPRSDLPTGMPHHAESKKTVQQKIQDIGSPENYVDSSELLRKSKLNKNKMEDNKEKEYNINNTSNKIDWNLPLLSGPNLNIVFEEFQKLQDLEQDGTKKKKFTPNLSYAHKIKFESSEPKPGPSMPIKKDLSVLPKESSQPLKNPRKKNVIQSEGLSVFGNIEDEVLTGGMRTKKSFLNMQDSMSKEHLDSLMHMLNVEERTPVDFKHIYKHSKQYNQRQVPCNDLPTGLPYHEESEKTIQQKIQDIESSENYDNTYVDSTELLPKSKTNKNDPLKRNPKVPMFILQTPGVFPSLIHREPHDGEEEIFVTDDAGRIASGYPCTLQDLPESKIGTLQILKSGKMKLKLGECDFWLTKGTETGIQEEMLVIDVNESEKSGVAYKIGDVNSHIAAMPDFLIAQKFSSLLKIDDDCNLCSDSD